MISYSNNFNFLPQIINIDYENEMIEFKNQNNLKQKLKLEEFITFKNNKDKNQKINCFLSIIENNNLPRRNPFNSFEKKILIL